MFKKAIKTFLLLLVTLFVLSGCSNNNETKQITSLEDLQHGTIGIVTGTTYDELSQIKFPEAELVYYNVLADAIQALKVGKIDAYLLDEPLARYAASEDKSILYLKEKLNTEQYATIFSKTEIGYQLKDEFNEYLEKITNDGTLKELQDHWLDAVELDNKDIDYENLEDINGTIRLGLNTQSMPFVYIKDGKFSGYELDVIYRFAKEYGYALTCEDVSTYSSLIAGIASTKYDMAASCITITDERAKIVAFSNPTYEGGIVAVVRNENAIEEVGFFESLSNSFENTFINENRWLMFLEGIGVTLIITLVSIVCGTLVGFLLYLLCKDGNKLANALTNICFWVVQMMPMVVLLMILYYLIFGSSHISAIWVACIGFTLTFSASVFSMLKVGVGAVPIGQEEAALSMGFTKNQAFFEFVLPQAIMHILPIYQGEIVSLIKGTAIVGYISVEDLTKVSDIVRSRTFEAFFPLIATAVIYAIIIELIIFFIKKIEIKIDPKKRSIDKILKGVKHDD